MSNQWQDKLRNGRPVKITRRIADGLYALEGEVTASDGSTMIMTWTKDGQHVYGKESDYDLIPIEAPAGVSADPDPRKALAEAAKAYKRAQDAVDAAVLASQVASNAFDDAFQALGKPDLAFVVHVDGKTFVFGEDGEFSHVEVL